MGLNDIVRSGVATASSVTATLQASVIHRPWVGFDDNYTKPKYGPPVARPALVEMVQRIVRGQNGEDVLQVAQVTFIGPVPANGADHRKEPIDPRDELTLPNGHVGPILSVNGLVDPGTDAPYLIEVSLG